jgi:anti-sigma-K factor RskA
VEIKDIISSGLLEMYVLGLTSATETQQVSTWISAYPEIAEEIKKIERSIETYGMANAVEPGAGVKANIMSAIQNNADARDHSAPARVVSISPAWKWAAAVLLIGSIALNGIYYNKYKKTDRAYRQTQEQLVAKNNELADMDRDMSVIQSRFSEPVALHGLDAAPDAAAKIFWMKNTGEVYLDPTNLPAAPEGKQYQLWAIVDGKPVDGGMIVATKKGRYQIQKMKSFGKAEAFAVTLETAGGNPTPKGEMYVMGKM